MVWLDVDTDVLFEVLKKGIIFSSCISICVFALPLGKTCNIRIVKANIIKINNSFFIYPTVKPKNFCMSFKIVEYVIPKYDKITIKKINKKSIITKSSKAPPLSFL
jgi:hypothetical protein